jgi:hypothetical protein
MLKLCDPEAREQFLASVEAHRAERKTQNRGKTLPKAATAREATREVAGARAAIAGPVQVELWTDEEIELVRLRALEPRTTLPDCAKHLPGRTLEACRAHYNLVPKRDAKGSEQGGSSSMPSAAKAFGRPSMNAASQPSRHVAPTTLDNAHGSALRRRAQGLRC